MNKKIILVTGANRGIGLELTRLLLAQKTFSVLFSCRNITDGKVKLAELSKIDSDIHLIELDVSNLSKITSSIYDILMKYGKIDVLVNNAGVYLDSEDLDEFPSFMDVTPEILEQTFNTNLFGSMILSQASLPVLSTNGLIINITSGGGKLNTSGDRSGHIAYRTSKTALNAFTKAFSKQKNPKNVKMIAICPGWVQTEMGGPNAPRTVYEGANDILKAILNSQNYIPGSFLYNSIEQKL